MDKRFTRIRRVREVENSNPKGRPNLTQRCKWFATASTSRKLVTRFGVIYGKYNERLGSLFYSLF